MQIAETRIRVACPECAVVQTVARAAQPRSLCFRCGADLVGSDAARPAAAPARARDRALAFTLAAVPLFVAAQCFPLMQMTGQGDRTQATVLGAVTAMNEQRLPVVAALVLLSTLLLPAVQLGGSAYVLIGLRLPHMLPASGAVYRLLAALRPWSQIDILLLAAVVAFAKLATVFQMLPGTGLACLVAALALQVAAGRAYDLRALAAQPWARPSAGAELHPGKRDSLPRTSALLIAATLVFLPANLLPMMTTRTLLGVRSDTIMSGVIKLWQDGSWPLAVIVFVASILIPALKIAALALLVATSRVSSAWRRQGRTRLYRLLERIGRWSMLDIFVMALLAALLRSHLAGVEIHPGAIAFAAVVVLTMLASASFDPRLIWKEAAP